MSVDMELPEDEKLQLARDALHAARVDHYRTYLNQPDDETGQKETLLQQLVDRAEKAQGEIDALEPKIKKAEQSQPKPASEPQAEQSQPKPASAAKAKDDK